jgi:hypothetical protein
MILHSSDEYSRDGSHRGPHADRNVGVLVDVVIVRLVVAVILAQVPTDAMETPSSRDAFFLFALDDPTTNASR